MSSLTEQLVKLIRAKPITDEDRRRAAWFVLDTIANALGARNTEPGRMLRAWFARQGADAGRQAFLLGSLAHILEMDDLHCASVTHPGCVVVPVALALHGRFSSAAMLDAVLTGYEAVTRIGMAVGPAHYRIWHSTATCGPFGAAMAAASLLGLDDSRTVHALGNAGTQSSGLWQFVETGAMSKHLHAGRAAEAGVTAAELAALGFTGPPAILEGARGMFAGSCPDADPGAVIRDPQAPWQLHATSIKPWPSCKHTHPAIDAAIELHGRLGEAVPQAVEVETYRAAIEVCDRPSPDSEYAAKFSLQHCVATALSEGCIGFEVLRWLGARAAGGAKQSRRIANRGAVRLFLSRNLGCPGGAAAAGRKQPRRRARSLQGRPRPAAWRCRDGQQGEATPRSWRDRRTEGTENRRQPAGARRE